MKRKRPASPTGTLEKRIGHRFKNKELLERALTHISATGGGTRADTYQRLEFLGDHVLGLAASEMLYRKFPRADEGELSQRLADLVRKDACAEVAVALDLGPHLRLGSGELGSGGRRKSAILADVCEAVVGAVFLDGGYDAALAMVERHWRARMLKPQRPLRDSKTLLQEWAQARGLPPPGYRQVERSGPDHRPEFRVEVVLPGFDPTAGVGRSKRDAEQAAATAMLAREGILDAIADNA